MQSDAAFGFWEGVFWQDRFSQLKLPAAKEAKAVYAFLSYQVRRRPKKLELHLCRILAAALIEEEALYAALLDLFWVLGSKGTVLKKRLFEGMRGHLTADHSLALEECLAGRKEMRELPFSARSLLHDGTLGERLDLAPEEAEATRDDPLKVAQLCLELGQLDQAQEILAVQLDKSPKRAEVRRLLLEIYLATQDREGFWQSYRRLEESGVLDESWRKAEVQFS
jgi:hypothetical protein